MNIVNFIYMLAFKTLQFVGEESVMTKEEIKRQERRGEIVTSQS